MQNPVHVTVIVLLVLSFFGFAFYTRHETDQDFPVIVRTTYAPLAGGSVPDVTEVHVQTRNAQALVESTLRNPLRRPEGIEVCELVERELVLRVEDDEYDNNRLRDCDLEFRTEAFFDYERARLQERARQLAAAEE